jgi:hypothetical protein
MHSNQEASKEIVADVSKKACHGTGSNDAHSDASFCPNLSIKTFGSQHSWQLSPFVM